MKLQSFGVFSSASNRWPNTTAALYIGPIFPQLTGLLQARVNVMLSRNLQDLSSRIIKKIIEISVANRMPGQLVCERHV
jgi:hypothetical protein